MQSDDEPLSDNSIFGELNDIAIQDLFKDESVLCACLLSLFISGKLTQQAFSSTCELLKLMSHNPENIPSSFDACYKKLMTDKFDKQIYSKHFYFKICKISFDFSAHTARFCPTCNKRFRINYSLSIAKQINLIFKKKSISSLRNSHSPNNDNITDFKDGRIYQEFINRDEIKDSKENIFSFLFNTDGISISKKSKLSIWPLILIINELPIGERFSYENIVLAGLQDLV